MTIEVLFEDADLVVINKPAGMVVNRARSAVGKTIQDWMEARYQLADRGAYKKQEADKNWWSLVPESFDSNYGQPEEIFFERSGMVHRLDKNTSGILVLAKNPGAMLALMAQFQQRQVQKTYTCLVHGSFVQDKDVIRLPIARSVRNRQRFAVMAEGRPAETEFGVQQRYQFDEQKLLAVVKAKGNAKIESDIKAKLRLYAGFSLIECYPKTGRTHQIRVHLAHFQHPLVGDELYVGKKRYKLDQLWCPRQFLHASQLVLHHPRTTEQLTFKALLAADLTEALTYLINQA